MSQWDDAARALVDELLRRSKGRLRIDDVTKEHLFREFADRLDVADNPDELLKRWGGNLNVYVQRAVAQKAAAGSSGPFDRQDVDRQFGICTEICPPPAFSSNGGSRYDGSKSK